MKCELCENYLEATFVVGSKPACVDCAEECIAKDQYGDLHVMRLFE